VFTRCAGIVDSSYFDPELRMAVAFILEYYENYSNIPTFRQLNAEFPNLEFEALPSVTKEEYQYTCDEIEKFCQESALFNALKDSVADITSGDRSKFGKVYTRVKQALEVSLQKDLGIDVLFNVRQQLLDLKESFQFHPTLIDALDKLLGGGLVPTQFTLFSANSGGGKSIMMANLAANYMKQGKNVLIISLELSEAMIFLRMMSILTNTSTENWEESIDFITNKVAEISANTTGSLILKRLPNGSNANDIRSYIKLYNIEKGYTPDVLILDYLDLLHPIAGVKNIGVFDQDKMKSEEVVDLLHEYNMIGVSASQQNRDGIDNPAPTQGVIAGGISKVNTVDNYISIYMDPAMRIKGDMVLYFLKTRSSKAVGSSTTTCFNSDTLYIGNEKVPTADIHSFRNRKKKNNELDFSKLREIAGEEVLVDEYFQEDQDPPPWEENNLKQNLQNLNNKNMKAKDANLLTLIGVLNEDTA
jgi:archaellum biogenesis ATPase FlaH